MKQLGAAFFYKRITLPLEGLYFSAVKLPGMIKNDLQQRPDYAQAIFETLVRIESLLQKNCWGNSPEPHKPALSIHEAADVLGVSSSMMKRLIYTKKVASVKVGSRVLVIRSSLLDVLSSE